MDASDASDRRIKGDTNQHLSTDPTIPWNDLDDQDDQFDDASSLVSYGTQATHDVSNAHSSSRAGATVPEKSFGRSSTSDSAPVSRGPRTTQATCQHYDSPMQGFVPSGPDYVSGRSNRAYDRSGVSVSSVPSSDVKPSSLTGRLAAAWEAQDHGLPSNMLGGFADFKHGLSSSSVGPHGSASTKQGLFRRLARKGSRKVVPV